MSYGVRSKFYKSKLWNDVRKSIWLKQNLLCAICNKPVYVDGISEYIPKEYRRTGIVHHKVFLDDINISDDNITINEDNLIGVCKECHEQIHHEDIAKRSDVMFDIDGNLIKRDNRGDMGK